MPKAALAVITGASSGIGSVFAQKLAQRKYDLLLIARRKQRLEELASSLRADHGVAVATFEADLASASGLDSAAHRLQAEPVDLLVNNAGFGTKGAFYRAPLEEQQRMHRLHVDAVLRLTHTVLAGMVERDRGAVINVSSVAAYTRRAGNVSYCATKAWINAFTEGIYLELKKSRSRVTVQALCPGFTYSEFHEVVGVDRASMAPRWLWMSGDQVVDASLRGLESRALFVVPGWQYRLVTMLVPRLPTALRLIIESGSPNTM